MDYFKDEAFKREVELAFDALVVMVKSLLVGNNEVVIGLLKRLLGDSLGGGEAKVIEKKRRGRPKREKV